MKPNRIALSRCFVLLMLTVLACSSVSGMAAEAEKPNLIFILVDDQGYYDLACYGATELETPRIDQLAAEGVRFTDYYAAAPICSPSRAGLLIGSYPKRVGMASWVLRADSRKGLHPDELTLAELLKSNGYATACIGKWHLGFHRPFLPRQQGFDHYFGLLHNLDPVETVYFEEEGGVPLIRNGEVVKRPAEPSELARQYTNEAIDFIEQNRNEPFFLYLPHTMLHRPLGVSERFKGSSDFGLYGDAIQEMDHHVGRLIDALERLGLDERTLVVYASDNGRGPGRTSEQPIRGHKLTTYEGGHSRAMHRLGAGSRGAVRARILGAGSRHGLVSDTGDVRRYQGAQGPGDRRTGYQPAPARAYRQRALARGGPLA